jgi:prevent-host-death family protein
MKLSVSEAKGKLTDLVRRARAGEEVILTRRGEPAVRLVPFRATPDAEAKRRLMEDIMDAGRRKAQRGAGAAEAAEFLYDETGLPR